MCKEKPEATEVFGILRILPPRYVYPSQISSCQCEEVLFSPSLVKSWALLNAAFFLFFFLNKDFILSVYVYVRLPTESRRDHRITWR